MQDDHIAWVKANTQLVTRLSNSRFADTHLTYLLETDTANSPDKLFNAIIEAAPEHKEKIMTVAQQLRQEGRQAGRHEGIVLGMEKGMARGMERRTLDIARNMLIKNTAPDFIRG